MRIAIALSFLLGIVVPGAAEAQVEPTDQRPVRELPRGITAVPGTFTLRADYGAPSHRGVPVYLINRTISAITLASQDGDPYLVREVELGGRWVRAERFESSFCGLSYYDMRIEPEHFVRVTGSFPSQGERGRLRYRLFRHPGQAVTNVGAGYFTRDDVSAAAHDTLSLSVGDVTQIESVLFAAPPIDPMERQMAFRRVAQIPASDATPLLLRLLGDPQRSSDDIAEALRALREVDRPTLVQHVRGVLSGGSARVRRVTLGALRYIESLEDPWLFNRLLELGRDPREPDLGYVIANLARARRPEVRELLISVRDGARYPTQARIEARYQLEQHFSTELVRVMASPVGNYSDGHPSPVRMVVTLHNVSARAIDYRYSRLTDFLSLYVTRSDDVDRVFIPPRQTVRWFTTPGSDTTLLHLEPGATVELPIVLLDYFDLPPGSQVTVWVSARLPGHGPIPQLGSGGSGVNIQP